MEEGRGKKLTFPGSEGPRVPESKGPRYLKVIFKYELDSKEGPSCYFIFIEIKLLQNEKMNFFYNLTNLSLAEKSDHFDSILKYCQVSGEAALDKDNAVSSSTPTDLTIRSQNSEGNSRTIP